MNWLDVIALWQKVKPWLDKLKSWFPRLSAWLASAVKAALKNANTTPELPRNHPDRKRKWPDDWNSDNDPA